MSKDVPAIHGCESEWQSDFRDADGLHCHRCPKCGSVWQHPSSCSGDDRAHRCPKEGCGGKEYMKEDLLDVKQVDFPWTGSLD